MVYNNYLIITNLGPWARLCRGKKWVAASGVGRAAVVVLGLRVFPPLVCRPQPLVDCWLLALVLPACWCKNYASRAQPDIKCLCLCLYVCVCLCVCVFFVMSVVCLGVVFVLFCVWAGVCVRVCVCFSLFVCCVVVILWFWLAASSSIVTANLPG